MPESYKLDANAVLKELKTSNKGLSKAEAKIRLYKHGANEIQEGKKTPWWIHFLAQFKETLVVILIIAGVVSMFFGEIIDTVAIFAIIVINAIIGFIQERKAEKSLEALKKMSAPRAEVMRNGTVSIIDAKELVPGDIVLLREGDRVPGDCRIIEQFNLRTDESALTGESTPVNKQVEKIESTVPVVERTNMVFSGTTVVYGHGNGLVVSTGMNTQFGKIARGLQNEDKVDTPLQKKLRVLGKHLGIIIIAISIIIFIAGVLRAPGTFSDPAAVNLMFLMAVSLAVAAIPEGLPAVVTITLAIGLIRMAKRNAIIRKLPSVETLGSTTVICSDKTGTLTVNQMTVKKIYVNNTVYNITGEGYSFEGKFLENGKPVRDDIEDVRRLLEIGMFCNNAILGKDAVGDPTEIALIVSARKYSISGKRGKRLAEVPFDSQRKMMSVIYDRDGRHMMYTKGAVEEILKRCNSILIGGRPELLTDVHKKRILAVNKEFAQDALRILGFAMKTVPTSQKTVPEKDLMFVGLQGMIDPPHKEVKESIQRCRSAGIKVVMITGDHKDTAVAVGKEVGLFDKGGIVLTGTDLDKMNQKALEKTVEDVVVYARVSPEHKVRITDAFKKRGHVVAMTGDGINDAPALKRADIGIAMGITGTDVSKEASSMVLTDDNFTSIVKAVEEGRNIYDNIKKFIVYLLSCNLSEVMVVFTSIIINLPLPLWPIQILWMNIATDGLPALGLGVEPPEKDVMKRKPRDPNENIMNRKTLFYITMIGIILGAGVLALFYVSIPEGEEKARTIAFSALVIGQMGVALSMRSHLPLWKINFFSNKKILLAVLSSIILQMIIVYMPALQSVFRTVPLGLIDWIKIFSLTIGVFAIIEVHKILRNKVHQQFIKS